MKISAMIRVFGMLLLSISIRISFAQTSGNPFLIKKIDVINPEERKSPADYKHYTTYLYEDDRYAVSRTCHGEFGGTIKFKDKQSGDQYECEAVCAVTVNKIDGKYFVTTSLAHMQGGTSILEIDDPMSMQKTIPPKPRKKDEIIVINTGSDESKSTIGTKTILDTLGVLTLISFPYQGKLYHITTDFNQTYLSEIISDHYVNLDTLYSKSFWAYNPEVIRTAANQYFYFFNNRDIRGYIEIYENKITINITGL